MYPVGMKTEMRRAMQNIVEGKQPGPALQAALDLLSGEGYTLKSVTNGSELYVTGEKPPAIPLAQKLQNMGIRWERARKGEYRVWVKPKKE